MSSQPEHSPQGDPCAKCGKLARQHRHRIRKREYQPRDRTVIGIDGEGWTTPDGRHLYSYLAACTAHRLIADVYNPVGLTSEEILQFLWELPKTALLVGFSLGYDRTKWFEQWPDHCIYQLTHSEHYPGEHGPIPSRHNGWAASLVSTRLTLKRDDERRTCTVWDIFKFFQSSFVAALSRWDIGTIEERERIEREKERRGSFDGIGTREKEYCQSECMLLAQLIRKLLDAHDAEGLRLNSYFGPGSTASIILRAHGEQRATIVYSELQHAIACAYFGGRFELSRVGPIPVKKLYVYDIASAYPHAMTQIPCMLHGKWVHLVGAIRPEKYPMASVMRFRVDAHPKANPAWGPLPHRMPDGNILFPHVSAGGWAWRDEIIAAKKLHPGISILEVWYWDSSCVCPPPFKAEIERLYQRRLAWGKGAQGLVLKLALNSLYGKSAQRVGKGRYRCMVRAGLITSLTRAKLLQAVSSAKRPWDVLELATDSVMSLTPLHLEQEGLGGWERKPWEHGVFLMRPGLRFALGKDDMKYVAARGVGVKTLFKNRVAVLAEWDREPMAPVTLKTPSFFFGARLAIRLRKGEETLDEQTFDFVRDAKYGTWTEDTRTLSYGPEPKRSAVLADYKLAPWKLPQTPECVSCPYEGQLSDIGESMELMRELESDQPDIDTLNMV
jgi:hypothetical protein